MATFFIWSGFYSFIANLFIGAFVFLREPKEKINRLFGIFSLLVACWSVGSFLENIITNKLLALWVLRLNYLFGVWSPPVYLHFVYALGASASNPSHPNELKAGYLISGILTPFVFTPYFIPRLRLMEGYDYYITSPGAVYFLFFAFFSVFMFKVLRRTLAELQNKKNPNRNVFRYVTFANCLAIFAGMEYFSRVFGVFKSPPLDDYILVIYVFVLAFAIARHRLFDLDTLLDLFQREKLAAIGILSASVNHELKNPLFLARATLETELSKLDTESLSKESMVSAFRQSSERVIAQMDRALDIMHRLTEFARPDTTQAQPGKIGVGELFTKVLELVNSQFTFNKIRLVKEIDEGLIISGNKRQLEEILFNLILNGCQAMKGGGQLTVSAEQQNGSVQIEIQDQGPGIPPDQCSKIFEPFYTTKESGTGLGLYITKQLVERNKGKISVESKVNKGTRFILKFPSTEKTFPALGV